MTKFFKIIFSVILVLIAFQSNAQQDPMYTQYMFNTLAINPAYAGSRNVISATALYRNQWVGIEGAPTTATFTIDAPVLAKKIGLGVQVFNDKLGISTNKGFILSGAYRIRMEKATLSFGIQSSINNRKANYSEVAYDEPGGGIDEAFKENANLTQFNFGSGVYYNSDKFYVGLGIPEFLPTKLSSFYSNNSNLPTRQQIHLFLTAGFVASLDDDFKLKPSFLLKAVSGAPLEGDINATLWIKDVLGLGAQYRTNADISALVQIQATQQIRIGYAYDHSVTKLRNFNSGSHEIMLRYEFGFEKDKVISPRYF